MPIDFKLWSTTLTWQEKNGEREGKSGGNEQNQGWKVGKIGEKKKNQEEKRKTITFSFPLPLWLTDRAGFFEFTEITNL